MFTEYEVTDRHYKEAKETMALFEGDLRDLVHVIADMTALIEHLRKEAR